MEEMSFNCYDSMYEAPAVCKRHRSSTSENEFEARNLTKISATTIRENLIEEFQSSSLSNSRNTTLIIFFAFVTLSIILGSLIINTIIRRRKKTNYVLTDESQCLGPLTSNSCKV